MNQEELQQKLEQASQFYNASAYDEAAAVWKDILQAEPQNERALEGLKMVELLTQDFTEPDTAPAAADAAQVQEAVQRVQELLDSGDTDAAREGVEVLLQIAPEDPAVQQCAARLEAGADPSEFTAEQLTLARHYVMMDDGDEAMEACRRVLSVDPDNAEAKELLSQAGSGEASSSPVASGPPVPTGEAFPEAPAAGESLEDDDLLSFDLDSLEDASGVPPAPDPMEAAIPPAAQAPAGDEDADQRIATLLTEGDALESQGDLQGAIQVWSRVFVLQDSNADAEERVDRARRILEEQAVRVDEMRFRAEDLLNAGNLAEARDEYQKVLEVLPNHLEAKEALRQIEVKLAGGSEATPAPDAGAEAIQAVPLALPEQPQEAAPQEPEFEEEVFLETPPQASPPERQTAAPAAAPARRRPGRALVLSMLVVGVVVVGAAGYVGWQILFPSGPSGELQGLEPQTLDRTSTAPSTAQPSADPVVPEPQAVGVPPASPPKQRVLDDAEARVVAKQVVEEASRLFDEGEYVLALKQFREALDLDSSNMDAKDWETKTAAEVERRAVFEREVTTIRAAFSDFDYESALKKLYRMRAPTEVGDAMVQRWKVTCWYNWGVLRLQGARLSEAEEKFQEVLGLKADDEQAASHLEVVRRYRDRPMDPSFKNYTNRLTLRQLD